MGRTIICEEHLLEDLGNVPNGNVIVPGLILGQFAGQRDYVIHLPKMCSIPTSVNENTQQVTRTTFTKIADINENAVSEHSSTVTRMLPGGMWILGYYIISNGDIFADKTAITKLKTLAQAVYNSTKGNTYLSGKNPSNQMLVFNFCSLSKKYSCKALDMSTLNSSFYPATWKFKTDVTTWLQIDSRFKLDWLPPFAVSRTGLTLKNKFQEVLAQFQKVLDASIFSINKDFCKLDTPLTVIEHHSNAEAQSGEEDTEDFNPNIFELMLYDYNEPRDYKNKMKEKSEVIPVSRTVKLCGVLGSRVFLNNNATAEDALKAVKEDLLRSLAARLEMHWQTFEEPENKKSHFLLRYPPRRVLFTPEGYNISFSEYIFEGETERDALATLCENLTLEDGEIVALEEPWEAPDFTDGGETDGSFENQNSTSRPQKSRKNQITFDVPGTNKSMTYGIIAASICLILSLVVHFFLK